MQYNELNMYALQTARQALKQSKQGRRMSEWANVRMQNKRD